MSAPNEEAIAGQKRKAPEPPSDEPSAAPTASLPMIDELGNPSEAPKRALYGISSKLKKGTLSLFVRIRVPSPCGPCDFHLQVQT